MFANSSGNGTDSNTTFASNSSGKGTSNTFISTNSGSGTGSNTTSEMFPSHTDVNQHKEYIQKGLFRLTNPNDPSDTELKEFTYIPKGYGNPDTKDQMDDIFTKMGVSVPDLCFYFSKSFGVGRPSAATVERILNDLVNDQEPDAEQKRNAEFDIFNNLPNMAPFDEEVQLIHHRTKTVLRGISETCSQMNAVFLMDNSFSGNILQELALETVAESQCKAIGLFNSGNFSYLNPNYFPESKSEIEVDREAVFSDNRNFGMEEVIAERTVALESDICDAIPITCELSQDEMDQTKKSMSKYKLQGGLVGKMTHPLVFATVPQLVAFRETFKKHIAYGAVLAGGTGWVYERMLDIMSKGRPLIVLDNTGGAADMISLLIRFYRKHIRPTAGPRNLQNSSLREEFLKFKEQNMKKKQTDSSAETTLSSWKCTYGMSPEMFVESWPQRFNENATVRVDIAKDPHIQTLQDRISRVMASVYDGVDGLGDKEAEGLAIEHTLLLQSKLFASAVSYKRIAYIMQMCIRMLLLATTTLTVVQAYLQLNGHPKGSAMTTVTLIVPLVTGAMITLFQVYRPLKKWAYLYSTVHKIESELWKFSARVGQYKPKVDGGHQHRIAFSKVISRLWTEVNGTDIQYGSLNSTKRSWKVMSLVKSNRVNPLPSGINQDSDSDDEEGNLYELEEARKENATLDISGLGPRDKLVRLKVMTAREYVDSRIVPAMAAYQSTSPKIARNNGILTILIVLITSSSTGFVHFGYEIWVPLLIAVVGFLEFIQSFWQYESRLPALNAASSALTGLLLLWDGQSLIHQRMPASKEALVQSAEAVIMAEVERLTQTTMSIDASLSGEDDKKKVQQSSGNEEEETDKKKAHTTPV
eukprot:CAMPEP_0175145468 /NCGR_PEP_ID=MMETSP0087-20121206/14788_1 /TAXON_ID=136419 /ORGANISM="Unknown Unknown, Strain D1" /LENGTH=868 /DNA_ID=CAMNT_0016430219 /DNA_START=65 /DNA_END=2671 /DNA_ORIENTATION=-